MRIMNGKGRQQAVLQRRNLELRALLLEQRDVDLMQPPDQEARPSSKGPAIVALFGRFFRHLP